MGNAALPESNATVARGAHRHNTGKPGAAFVLLVSLLILVPCFWQKRIQATDLSSHVYNAWLASLAEQGRTPGVYVARQWSNVAFDVGLEWLLVRVGASAAQRIMVSVAVLIFFWGAIMLASVVSGKNWWFTIPWVAVLTYGVVFHMGFFNFYLSLGICFWYLALVWKRGMQRLLLATPLLLLAWTAHPLPVVWAIGMLLYVRIARRLRGLQTLWLLGAAIVLLVAIREILMKLFAGFWSWKQIYFVTGINQPVFFNPAYTPIFGLFLLAGLISLRTFVKQHGMTGATKSIPLQLFMLNAAAVFVLPSVIEFPRYAIPFSYITDRLSLTAGVMACAFLALAPVKRGQKLLLVLAGVAFFCLVFMDTWKLNRVEDSVHQLVAQLPPGARVLGYFPTRNRHISPALHTLDRACIDHCFSYGNYEPMSRQFRVRAVPGNAFVIADFKDEHAVDTGQYVVQPRDLPVYLISLCGQMRDHVCSKPLQAGEIVAQ
jgi:hypothetical protein